MSTSRLTAGNVIARLTEAKILTPGAHEALIARFDPMHDTQIKFVGAPTAETGSVFTWHYDHEVSIGQQTAPFTLDPLLPYDMLIQTWPIGQKATLQSGQYHGNMALNTNEEQPGSVIAPVTIQYRQGALSFGYLPTAPTGATNANYKYALEYPAELISGKCQIVGQGLELIPTTPVIQKGGSVMGCSFTQPPVRETVDVEVLVYDGDTIQSEGSCACRPLNVGPVVPSEILQFQNSFYGSAENGAYFQMPFNLTANIDDNCAVQPLVMNSTQSDVLINKPCEMPIRNLITVGTETRPVFNQSITHFEGGSSIILLQNLPPATTFDLRVRTWGQNFPTTNVNQLASAHPSIPWNEMYLELVQQIANEVKAGCYFTENPSGEWWKGIARTVLSVAPAVLSMMPDPRLKAAGAAFTAMAPSLETMLAEDMEKKKKRQKNNSEGKYGPGMKKNKNRQIVPKKRKKKTNGDWVPPPHKGSAIPGTGWEEGGGSILANQQRQKLQLQQRQTPVRPLRGRGGTR
jgi:hypothetical protein